MSLYILITLLKGIALITPSNEDNKIVSLIAQIYKTLRSGKAPAAIPGEETFDGNTEAKAKDKKSLPETPETSDVIH
jgi:hypothetical protein